MTDATLITWDTWSGKTYHAITQHKWKYAYVAPCKQLVYEVFQDYGDKNTKVSTWDVHLDGDGNFMGTYEALRPEQVKDYDRVIIDEFHYVGDFERGWHLLDIVNACRDAQIPLLGLTATQNLDASLLRSLQMKTKHLDAWKKVPEKKEIEFEQFLENARNGHSSIYFCKYTPDAWLKQYFMDVLWLQDDEVAILSASDTSMERITVQNRFRSWEIKFLICTNVLAQWLNFPATNLAIEYNQYDGREIIEQKLGRLGRPTFSDNVEEVYYCLHERPNKRKIKDLIHQDEERVDRTDVAPEVLNRSYTPHEIITYEKLCWWYKTYKYCFPSLEEIVRTGNYFEHIEEELHAAYAFILEDRTKLHEFLSQVRAAK